MHLTGHAFADQEGGGQGEKSQNIGFLCNTGPDPLKNHKTITPAFNVGPSSSTKKKKKRYQMWTPSEKTFWIRA